MTKHCAAAMLALFMAGCMGPGPEPEFQAAADPDKTECAGTFPAEGAVAPVQVGQNGGAGPGPGC